MPAPTPPAHAKHRFRCLSSRIGSLVVAAGVVISVVLAAFPSRADDTINQFLADGFDFPVGKPDGFGYYRARGFWPNGHLGEDWNGRGGGNSDLGDPVYAIGHGVVVFSANYQKGWGNVVIIRHAYRDANGRVNYIDSLYGHLDKRLVNLHDKVKRSQAIGTIGTNFGMYVAHLHFEIRKNLHIGMDRSKFKGDYSNYFSPTQFVNEHRTLRTGFREHSIPLNTFGTPDSTFTSAPQPQLVIPVNESPSREKTTHPLLQANTSQRQMSEQIEKVLDNYEPTEERDTKSFWQWIKAKLRGRPEGEGAAEEP